MNISEVINNKRRLLVVMIFLTIKIAFASNTKNSNIPSLQRAFSVATSVVDAANPSADLLPNGLSGSGGKNSDKELAANNSTPNIPSLNRAFSVATNLAEVGIPPKASQPKIQNYIPPYTPPVPPKEMANSLNQITNQLQASSNNMQSTALENGLSVTQTIIDTANPTSTKMALKSPVSVLPPAVLPAAAQPISAPVLPTKQPEQIIKKNESNLFQNSHVITKNIALNQVHSDPTFKQKVTDAWQQISAGDPHAFMNVNSNNATVYIKGDQQHVVDLENYISSLDKPVVQVRVDAIILFAQRNYNFDIGIDWSGIYNRAQSIINSANPFGFVGMGGQLQEIPKPTSPVDSFYTSSAGVPSTGSSPNNNLFIDPTNFAVNLFNKAFSATTPDNAGQSFLQLPFVFGGPDLNLRRLNLVLNVAESESKVKILSRPSVLTSSGQKAVVNIGQQLPMQQSAINSTTGTVYKGSQIVYKSVGISLKVLPIVGADNKTISLNIEIADLEIISGSTQSNADGIMTNPPVLSDLAVTNIVTLKSGQTTVIGGLAKRTDKITKNQVPWINRIPVFGNLFKASLSSDVELEQFIFITPTIVEENL